MNRFKKISRSRTTTEAHDHKNTSQHVVASRKNQPVKTERGIASFYVAIFATLVFGIITLSFMRIMLSESRQASNSDLSRSAYDSALAGIEDGKIAVLKYHECISQGNPHASSLSNWYSGNGKECSRIIQNMEYGIKINSCDTVARVLGRTMSSSDGGEVLVQEKVYSSASDSSKDLEQAYTCVKVTEDNNDYLSTLNQNDRIRVIPLRTEDTSTFNMVRLQWYSKDNYNYQSKSSSGTSKYYSYNLTQPKFTSGAMTPPPLAISFIQTDQSFKLNELSVSKTQGNTYGTDVSRLTFKPSTAGHTTIEDASKNIITARQVVAGANKSTAAPSNTERPSKVKCKTASQMKNAEFACAVDIELPKTFNFSDYRNINTAFLTVSLLYGEPVTDFSVNLCNKNGSSADCNNVSFAGVQTSIDSTGRANDLYRRVETRVDLYDIGFPYPEYAIQSDGNGSINKNFYVTKNCWYSNSQTTADVNTNTGGTCRNNNASW